MKPSDKLTLPLCHAHHSEQTLCKSGELGFWRKYLAIDKQLVVRVMRALARSLYKDEIGVTELRAALREMIEVNKIMFRAIAQAAPDEGSRILDWMENEQKTAGIEDGYGTRAQNALNSAAPLTNSLRREERDA